MAGVFGEVAMAMAMMGVMVGMGMGMGHLAPEETCACSSLAGTDRQVGYGGTAAPAAVAPHKGRNAASALTVAQVAAGLLGQRLQPARLMYEIFTNGGAAPDIVPANTSALYYLGAPDVESLTQLETRIRAGFEAAAVTTGCTHEVTQVSPVHTQLVPDPWRAAAYRVAIAELGRSPLRPEDERARYLGSTDLGNMSRVLPVIHPTIAIDCGDAVHHQPEFTRARATPSADRAVCDGALTLTRIRLAAATDDAQRDRLIGGVSRCRAVSGSTAGGVA